MITNIGGIGKLRHRVKVQNYIETVNNIGEPVKTYAIRQAITMSDDYVFGSLSDLTGATSGASGTVYDSDGYVLYVLRSTATPFQSGELIEEDPTESVIESVSDVDVEIFAYVRPLSAKELETAMQRYGEVSHAVVIRYRDDIDTNTRLEFDGRYLDVNGVLNYDEQDIHLKLMCKEAV